MGRLFCEPNVIIWFIIRETQEESNSEGKRGDSGNKIGVEQKVEVMKGRDHKPRNAGSF